MINLDRFRDVDLVIDKANDNFIEKKWVSTGDREGRTLTVMVTDGGVTGELPGASVSLLWTNKANGLTDETAFVLKDKATSTFVIEYPMHMLTPGPVIAQIRVWHNGKTITTKPFEITVSGIAGQMKGVVAQQEFGLLTDVLADANSFRYDISRKADKDYVDTSIASIATGDPKELFYSVVELKSKYPNGANGTYIVYTDAPYLYYWDGENWINIGKHNSDNTDFPATNAMLNSNFNNTDYWNGVSMTLNANNHILTGTIASLTGSHRIEQNVNNIIAGHKYFVKVFIKPQYADLTYFVVGDSTVFKTFNPTAGQWSEIADVITAVDAGRLRLYHRIGSNYKIGDTIQLKYILAWDLTQSFGAGKEPKTTAECLVYLKGYQDNWFDGIKTPLLSNRDIGIDINLLNLKNGMLATIQQPTFDNFGNLIRVVEKNGEEILMDTSYDYVNNRLIKIEEKTNRQTIITKLNYKADGTFLNTQTEILQGGL